MSDTYSKTESGLTVGPIHSPDHPSRTGEEVACERCGRLFRPWKMNGGKGRFCSRFCADRAQMTVEPSDTPVVPRTAEERDRWLAESRAALAEAWADVARLEAMTFDDEEVTP